MRPVLLGLMLVVSVSGCKRTPTEVRGSDGASDLSLPSIESGLHVVVVSPSRVSPNTPTPASIVGAGFLPGSSVRVGSYAVAGVTRVDENTLRLTLPGLPAGTYDVTVDTPDGQSATLRSGLTVGGSVASANSCPRVIAHFDLDRSVLRPADRASLDGAMSCYRSATAGLRIEGHADERGTTDYNLALGQRRADSVRLHVATGGVPGSRITTVSYGEERPTARGSGEAVWSENRRAEIFLQN
jgi:outer membrane protein OmpA-like peptidoglycan-associated protein